MPNISAKSWNRFIVHNFTVLPELMGEQHEFQFQEHDIAVRLPTMENADRDSRFDSVARIMSWRKYNEESSPFAYKHNDEIVEPIEFSVEKVDVEIEIPGMISVPNESLINPPNQYEHLTSEQTQTLKKLSSEHSLLSKNAFSYWLEIIRWSTGNALIGHEIFQNRYREWSTRIFEAASDHHVWAGESTFLVTETKPVTKDHWMLAESRLKSGDAIPMHIQFIINAEQSARNSFYEKAIIETAMACETYLRYTVLGYMPKKLQQDIVGYIESANINQYSSHFFKNLVATESEKEYSKLRKDIDSLISKRNSYLHMGKYDSHNTNCYRYIDSIKKLFDLTLKPIGSD
jgi:hypothetical protein